ncbi:LEAF RUST 10 DISEASE-RESISTANCE LOCUS RECEPTOR-LIKE PROTEIN KINASE-like 2.4 [Cardamine amara subsp. amara]|uniref:non-specific serine/threonine protein kinase n=1 Tax=Cardamine amara subsp. amara TaxID=228776 RepID=A0ABD1BHS4_CARAN
MYYLPTSCLVFFFLFSLFHPLPCASSKREHRRCEAQFQCGNITAGFPFWGEKRYIRCGHPLLELQCFDSITSLIISDIFYNVLHIDQTSNTLRLARTDVLGSVCSNATLPPQIFDLLPAYKSVTLYSCLSDHKNLQEPYLSSNPCPNAESESPVYPESCHNLTVNVPEEKDLNLINLESVLGEGFEVKVKIDEKACQECLSTHKLCGFNVSSPLEVKCGPLQQPTSKFLILQYHFLSIFFNILY